MTPVIAPEPSPTPASSRYFQWIIGMMIVAYLATSVDYRALRMKKPMITVGSNGWTMPEAEQRMRQEMMMSYLDPFAPPQEKPVMTWLSLACQHEMMDQEALALGLEVSEDSVRRSLQYKLAFLKPNGEMDTARRSIYYRNNLDALLMDRAMIHEENLSLLECDYNVWNKQWDQRQGSDEKDNTPLQTRIQRFLVKYRLTWGQLMDAERRLLRRVHLKKCVNNHRVVPGKFLTTAVRGIQMKVTSQWRFFPASSSEQRLSFAEIAEHKRLLMSKTPDVLKETGPLAEVTVMRTPNFRTLAPEYQKKGDLIEKALTSGDSLEQIAKKQGFKAVRATIDPQGMTILGQPLDDAFDAKEGTTSHSVGTQVAKRVHEKRQDDQKDGWFRQNLFLGGQVWVKIHHMHTSRPLTQQEIDAKVRASLSKQKAVQQATQDAVAFQKSLQAGKAKKASLLKTMQRHVTSALPLNNQKETFGPWKSLQGPLWGLLKESNGTPQIVPQHNGCWVGMIERVEQDIPKSKDGQPIDARKMEEKMEEQWTNDLENDWTQRVMSLITTSTDPEQWSAWVQRLGGSPTESEDNEEYLTDDID